MTAPTPDSGDPRAGLFGPGSVTWKVNRESVLLLGGGRALLMQIAHPLVAAGVAEHSDFRRDPLGRLRRTLDAMLTITFGTAAEARAVWRRVDAVHARVRGRLGEDAGANAAGTRYRARDPRLQLWVHATLVDTARRIYRRYVGDLGPAAWRRYYEESKVTARLFRIPEDVLPPDLEAFDRYVRDMIEGDELFVTPAAREIARSILRPPIPLLPSAVFETVNLVTVGLLPRRLREQFGLPWSPVRRLLLDASTLAVRSVLPLLPDLVRAMPPARAADRRVAAA